MKWKAESPADLPHIAAELLSHFRERRVFAFKGQMGAGKTTFIKTLCENLGVNDPTSSPSFSIVNEYHTNTGETVYHFDCYRLKKPEEAVDIGFEEYVNSGNYCFIEWPEMIEELLPEEVVMLSIRLEGEIRVFEAVR